MFFYKMPEIDWSKHTLTEKDFHFHVSHFLLPLKVHVLAVAILNYHVSLPRATERCLSSPFTAARDEDALF